MTAHGTAAVLPVDSLLTASLVDMRVIKLCMYLRSPQTQLQASHVSAHDSDQEEDARGGDNVC